MARPSPFVFGNYCGPGTRTGDMSARPVDRLDAACQTHDACYIARHNHCDCDGALVASARAIRDDKTAPRKMRSEAELLIATFAIPVCKVFPQGFMMVLDPAFYVRMKPIYDDYLAHSNRVSSNVTIPWIYRLLFDEAWVKQAF